MRVSCTRPVRVAVFSLIVLLVTSCSPTTPPEPPPPDWLWVSVWGSNALLVFDDDQQATGATGAEARVAIGLGPGRSPYGFDFDADGNLWVGTQQGELLRYAAADVGASGTPEPTTALPTGALHVAGVRIAPDGSLWATMQDTIRGWRADTLTAGGSPVSDVTITSPALAPYPNELVFDDEGGLWTVGSDSVLRFAPDQLVVGGALVPEVVIASDGTSLKNPKGLAFDANGDLWVSTLGSSRVEKFRRQDLVASGSPAPVVTLLPPGVMKMRVRFDAADNLWVSTVFNPGWQTAGYIAMIAPQHRVASGQAVATVELSELGSFDVGGAMAFHPLPR